MQIDGVRKNVDELWIDTASSWTDDMSRRYKSLILDKLDDLLKDMQTSCTELILARDSALNRLREIQDDENVPRRSRKLQ